jgi:hypothetical protein
MFGVYRPAAVGGILVALIFAGCESRPAFEFEGLDMAPPQEELSEFSLGEYRIPIPVPEERGQAKTVYRNRLQFDFELHALVSPAGQAQVADAWSRHEGKIRDQVIRICRGATVEELQEPELATLKGRLRDALASQMGGHEVQQLLLTEVVSQEL